jgi:site-specific DNA recombinase
MNARVRCAVYTRKSSDEGLDQAFNSLDAQREACEAFILSQKHEGWTLIPTRYDDGGFSGGTMDRPALKRLIADIAEGKVKTVVVYKVDRLTRSLADFAKIIEQFDSKGVNFVSVTQQFNTTTSMGRLTLNVLLSFAQFEREVTGERIRDKIAASKAKGMWMGGRVPLGYDLRDRKLYVNPGEAKTVREIFQQYLRLQTVTSLTSYLDKSGIRSKVRIGPDHALSGGQSFSRGALYQLLRNHIYVGEIEHKGSIYPGEHDAIIDRQTWKRVQVLLDDNRQGERNRSRRSIGSLLTGLLFTESGVRYIPTHSQKGDRRYHFYTSQAVIKGEGKGESTGRLAAPAIERAVEERIQAFLSSPTEILEAIKKQSDAPELSIERVLKCAREASTAWKHGDRNSIFEWIRILLHRALVCEGKMELQVNLDTLVPWLMGKDVQRPSAPCKPLVFTLTTPFRHVPHGRTLKLVIGNEGSEALVSRHAIARAIARARSWYELIVDGKASGLADLARQERLTPRYIKSIFPLAFLSPEAIEFLLDSRGGQLRTLDSLCRKVLIPWDAQKAFLLKLQP